MMRRCCALLRETGGHLVAAYNKMYAMAYLVVIYITFLWLDAMERRKAPPPAPKKKKNALEIHHAELLFDYDERQAFSADGAAPPVTTFDITSQIEQTGHTLSEDTLRINPFAKLESWPLIAEGLLGELCPSRRIRCEVRYTLGDTKYRRVLFLDDPLSDFAANPGGRADPPPRAHIISAKLCGPDSADVDVTARVKRYLGPDGNWHGSKELLARDLFPHDRHDSNAESFDCVRIVDGFATRHTVPYPDGKLPDLSQPI